MQFFYTIGIYCYAFLVRFVSPFNAKAKLWCQGRKNVFENIEGLLKDFDNQRVWVHVSSLGEFEQGRPLIEKIKEKYPNYKIILTFFSPSGYEIRKNYELADMISYLPIDTAKNAKRFFDIVKPSKVFFVKYDFWYYYLREAFERKVPTYLISALFRKDQLFFKTYGGFYRKILHFFTTIFVQDETSRKLLESVNYTNAIVAGDTRVDRVVALAEQVKEIPKIVDFKDENTLLVVGSSWRVDEELLVQFLQKHLVENSLKVVLAPHEVQCSHIQQIQKMLDNAKISHRNYSEFTTETTQDFDVLIIDSIGILSSLYQYADIAYIGGGFGAGIHNTLEPATFGVPIVFGKKYKKFSEAVALVAQKGAFSIENYSQCEKILCELMQNKIVQNKAGEICRAFVNKQKGAISIVVSSCFSENC